MTCELYEDCRLIALMFDPLHKNDWKESESRKCRECCEKLLKYWEGLRKKHERSDVWKSPDTKVGPGIWSKF